MFQRNFSLFYTILNDFFNLLNKTISISFIFFFKKTTCIKVAILVRVPDRFAYTIELYR